MPLAHVDKSIQLNDDDAPRCPNCAKRLSAELSACPSCGYPLISHRERIRCSRCGDRIPAQSTICPHCKGDPRAPRISPTVVRIVLIAATLFFVVCIGWISFRVLATNTLQRALGLNQPTLAPKQVIQVIYVIATPITPTSPTPTMTLIANWSPTPTRRAARTPSPELPTSTPGFYAAPQLTGPANTTVYTGAGAVIVLAWQPVAPSGLRENEWYQITLTFAGRDGSLAERKSFTKESRWVVPNAWWNDIAPDVRTVKWNTTIVRIEGADPFAAPNRTPGSTSSPTRTFIWN